VLPDFPKPQRKIFRRRAYCSEKKFFVQLHSSTEMGHRRSLASPGSTLRQPAGIPHATYRLRLALPLAEEYRWRNMETLAEPRDVVALQSTLAGKNQ
jgi:hypothetical protein